MDMLGTDTVNALRTIVTVLAFTAFIGIVFYAWSGARREKFAEAARIPFEEDGAHTETESQDSLNIDNTDTKRIDAERSGK
ncbi:MAG: cbb3-type cytochrome c oxidase subunit 3 [Betaproteobacteria bacterium]|nr:MAG: cbb3-type cytochrome c oxidase subunit 3 [Betaproteobacteria bacterium]